MSERENMSVRPHENGNSNSGHLTRIVKVV